MYKNFECRTMDTDASKLNNYALMLSCENQTNNTIAYNRNIIHLRIGSGSINGYSYKDVFLYIGRGSSSVNDKSYLLDLTENNTSIDLKLVRKDKTLFLYAKNNLSGTHLYLQVLYCNKKSFFNFYNYNDFDKSIEDLQNEYDQICENKIPSRKDLSDDTILIPTTNNNYSRFMEIKSTYDTQGFTGSILVTENDNEERNTFSGIYSIKTRKKNGQYLVTIDLITNTSKGKYVPPVVGVLENNSVNLYITSNNRSYTIKLLSYNSMDNGTSFNFFEGKPPVEILEENIITSTKDMYCNSEEITLSEGVTNGATASRFQYVNDMCNLILNVNTSTFKDKTVLGVVSRPPSVKYRFTCAYTSDYGTYGTGYLDINSSGEIIITGVKGTNIICNATYLL